MILKLIRQYNNRDEMDTLGFCIREFRQSRNLTLEQVAEETGFSVSFLSMVERNKASISVDNLERLARYYNVHMVHFFSGPAESPVLITRREELLENMDRKKRGRPLGTPEGNRLAQDFWV